MCVVCIRMREGKRYGGRASRERGERIREGREEKREKERGERERERRGERRREEKRRERRRESEGTRDDEWLGLVRVMHEGRHFSVTTSTRSRVKCF